MLEVLQVSVARHKRAQADGTAPTLRLETAACVQVGQRAVDKTNASQCVGAGIIGRHERGDMEAKVIRGLEIEQV